MTGGNRLIEGLNWRRTHHAREALQDLLEPVSVRPHESGEYLVAQVGINATPLLRAAGIASNGSGGLICSRAKVEVPLRRVA